MQVTTACARIANQVRRFRATRGLSQQGLSNRASFGVSRRTVQRIEQAGRDPYFNYDPKLSTLLKVSHGLRLSLADLVGQVSAAANRATTE